MRKEKCAMPAEKSVAAVVVAGGLGTRMNAPVPKQFLILKGKPVVQWSLECFDNTPEITRLILVLPQEWLDEGRDKLINFKPQKPFAIVSGGARRQDSVLAGVKAVTAYVNWVAVHDGARPGIQPELISRAVNAAFLSGNSVCVMPSNDTLIRVVDGVMVAPVDRREIYRVQTPQIFRCVTLLAALDFAEKNHITATDEASIVRELGHKIHLVEGSEANVKVTRSEDLEILAALL